MKNINIKFITAILATFALTTSCSDDVLDTVDSSSFQDELIFQDPNLTDRLVLTTYNSTESWGFNRQQWWSRRFNIENASFESKFNFRDIDQFRVRAGWTPGNMGVFTEKWNTYWFYMRQANDFLDRIDGTEAAIQNPEKIELQKAEMRFLRANLYSKLIKFYGGVPLITSTTKLKDDFSTTKRDSYKDCVDFIVQELDEVIAILPDEWPGAEYGRATKLAAMAIKSRTLLYAASKLHDPSTTPSGPLYDYDVATKWEDASKAAKDIIDVVGARDLITVADATEYQNLFLSVNQDILFARPFGSLFEFGTDVNSLWDQTQSPSGYSGWALSSPTHNFTLQFNFADGTSTNGVTPAEPNANREMRYYANLNYNGSEFRGRNVEYFVVTDSITKTVDGKDIEVPVFPHGLDSSFGLGNVLHSSKTGYNIRKFQDETRGLTEASPGRPFILYRLAETYLNYAEAEFNRGNEGIALEYVNKVATRALLPSITASGDDLLGAIKRERRIELCFEGHNFFDERRWMNEAHLGFDIKGLRWTKTADETVSHEEYTVVTRGWEDKQYYLPIPQAEIEKVALAQNNGY